MRETETVLCLCILMQTLREVARVLKLPFKPWTFGLGRTQQLSISPDLLLVLAPGYINTAKQFLFLYYYKLHFISNVSNRSLKFIEWCFNVILTSLSSFSDKNYKSVDLYRVDEA